MIRADRTRCCGAGMCVLIEDTVFEQDATGLVVIDDDAAARPIRRCWRMP